MLPRAAVLPFAYSIFLALLLHCLCMEVESLNPIEIDSYKFFDAVTGKEFRVKGVAYYPRPNAGPLNKISVDYFTDEFAQIWKRDISKLKSLGVNTVRLYSVDPSKSHDGFMCELAKHGMYAIVGMAAAPKNESIPAVPPPECYFPSLYTRTQKIYNQFAVYNNTLAFSIGNENNNGMIGPGTLPCVKALLRDTRDYASRCRKKVNLRQAPIGLFLADSGATRPELISYFDCIRDGDENTRMDWYGLNVYLECDPMEVRKFEDSVGFTGLAKDFEQSGYSGPIILGEFGCVSGVNNTINGYTQQREFYQARWMHLEPNLTRLVTGGNVFEYSIEKIKMAIPPPFMKRDINKYGLGFFQPDHCDDISVGCVFEEHPAFGKLAAVYNSIEDSRLMRHEFSRRTKILDCPAFLRNIPLPPTPNAESQVCSTRKPVCPTPVFIDAKSTSLNAISEDRAEIDGQSQKTESCCLFTTIGMLRCGADLAFLWTAGATKALKGLIFSFAF